jgi:hypothetical protein
MQMFSPIIPVFRNDLSRFSAEVLHSRQHLYKLGCRAKNHLSEIRADPRDPWRFLTREAITPEFYRKIGSTLHKIIRFDEKIRRSSDTELVYVLDFLKMLWGGEIF